MCILILPSSIVERGKSSLPVGHRSGRNVVMMEICFGNGVFEGHFSKKKEYHRNKLEAFQFIGDRKS